MVRNDRSKIHVEATLLQQMRKYLNSEITKEEYAIIAEEFFTNYGYIIAGTKFYEVFSDNILNCCLINNDEPGNEDEKEREFQKIIRDIYEQLVDLSGLPEMYVFNGQDDFDSIDYIYLSVEFSDGGKTYYYLTEDETIKIGDFVKVPVRNSELKIVKVVNVEKFKENQVPMPMERVKHIIGKMQDMNTTTENDVIEAHRYSSDNKPALLKDSRCGCFYCLKIFDPKEIKEYLDDDNELDQYGTAECPYCGIDSVIPESSGYPITEEFLKRMYRCWFGSGTGITLITPIGKLELLKDGKPVAFFHNSIDPNAELFPDVDEIQRLEYEYVSDGKSHTLSFVVKGKNIKGTVESGEILEAISFCQDKCKLTLSCIASFGDYKEYYLDYDGYYCDEGIVITIFPETRSQVFKFGACWLSNYSGEKDNQTWFGADPTI